MASPATEQPTSYKARFSSAYSNFALTSQPFAFLPAVLLFYAVLLPQEIRITIAEQSLYPTRLAAIALLPWMIWKLAQRRVVFRFWDYLFFLACFWMVFAYMVYYGPAIGLRRGGILAFDSAMPYLVGRLSFRNATDVRRFLVIIAPGLFLAGSTMVLEVIMSRPIIGPAAASIFGNLSAYEGGVAIGARESFIDSRLGILRATGPFSHPILAGVLLASFLPIYLTSSLRKWPLFVGIGASFFAVFSASSAAFLSLLISTGLLLVDRVQRILAFVSWKIILPVVGATLLILEIASDKGLIVFLSRYTLDPRTAAFRRVIWDYGTRSVEKHPWFGIGYTAYERPVWMLTSSVDNHWLLLAMRFGMIPAFAILIVVIASITLLATSTRNLPEADRRLHVGLAISVFGVALLGFAVAFFGGALYWFYMLFAIGISIGSAPVPKRAVMPARNPPLALGHAASADQSRHAHVSQHR